MQNIKLKDIIEYFNYLKKTIVLHLKLTKISSEKKQYLCISIKNNEITQKFSLHYHRFPKCDIQ